MIERCSGSNLPALENNNFTGEFIMIRIIVTGAAGRMGRRLVANIAESGDLKLAGATERPGSEFLGLDAGTVAGVAPQGVRITDDFAGLVSQADAVIDFSTGAVIANARLAASKGLSIVIGTTALTADDKAELKKLADAGAKIVFASNYSVGVNLLFYLTKLAAQTLSDDFDIEIIEAHHNQKKDAPSGTAVSLAEVIANVKGWDYDKDVRHGRVGNVGARTRHEIGMHAVRGGDIVGDHTVMFAANGERVELTHKASSRDTFAKGALRAVRFLANAKPGLYNMQDVLGLK